jgi:L-fuconolactonase
MRLDSHQHFWIYDSKRHDWISNDMDVIRQFFLPDDLIPILKSNNMDGCIAVQTDQTDTETMFLLALADKYEQFIKGVVGWTDLIANDLYDKLEFFSQYESLKGFRHIAQSEANDFLSRPATIKGIRQLAAFDFTYDILVNPTQLKAALQLVREVSDVKFVIDHLAKPYIREQKLNTWSNYMQQIAQNPNVYCKISGMVTEANWINWKKEDFYPYLDIAFENFGIDRLLFGSDWPVCLVAAEYEQVIGIVENYMNAVGFSDTDKAKVFGLNTMTFYGIE